MELLDCYHRCHDTGAFQQTGKAIGQRALKNTCLAYLSVLDNSAYSELALNQYELQGNMTDVGAALSVLIGQKDETTAAKTLADFYERWQHDAQVVCQWFAMQAGANVASRLKVVKSLLEHEAFDIRNPNKVRSVVGSFIRSPINFHAVNGSGYEFVADLVLKLDAINPMIAANLAKPLGRFKSHTPNRQAMMKAQLQRLTQSKLSTDVYEVVTKALATNE